MRVVSLFSGIGAHDLGLEWAGMTIVGQVEFDEYCTKVLEKHWPKVKRFSDIRTVSANDIRRLKPDLITGGFPCQDISVAGKQAGVVEGEKSSLWREMWRIIRDVRPTWLLVENVPALRTNGADTVLSALEAIGYTCWPLVVGAWAVGAPHKRNRVWIVANHNSERRQRKRLSPTARRINHPQAESTSELDNAEGARLQTGGVSSGNEKEHARFANTSIDVLNADGDALRLESGWCCGKSGAQATFTFPARPGECQHEWEADRTLKPRLGGATDGASGWVDKNKRLKALGNANPPQVVAMIGRAIMHVQSQIETE